MSCADLKDYYLVLGIAETASYDEIKTRYRQLVKRWHPDNCNEPNAHARFVEIAEAYEILKSPETRNIYDHERNEYIRNQKPAYSGGYEKASTYEHTSTDNRNWEEFIRRQKAANRQAEYYANQSVDEVLAYLKDRILYGQSALRGNLGFLARSFIGFRALFLIAILIIGAVTVVGAPIAIYSFFALRDSLTYKGYYIGIVTMFTSLLMAVAELVFIVFVLSLI